MLQDHTGGPVDAGFGERGRGNNSFRFSEQIPRKGNGIDSKIEQSAAAEFGRVDPMLRINR